MTTEIHAYGIIGWDVTPDLFRALLPPDKDAPVVVRLNSPGGEIYDASAIRSLLLDHSDVTVRVDGIAASAATIVALGARRIEMVQGSAWMVHAPWTVAAGNGDDLARLSVDLETAAMQYAELYASRTGRPADEIREEMRAERTISAEEAVRLGYADAVIPGVAAPFAVDPEDSQESRGLLSRIAATLGGRAPEYDPSVHVQALRGALQAATAQAIAARQDASQYRVEAVEVEALRASLQAVTAQGAALQASIDTMQAEHSAALAALAAAHAAEVQSLADSHALALEEARLSLVAGLQPTPPEEGAPTTHIGVWEALRKADPVQAAEYYETHRSRILRGE